MHGRFLFDCCHDGFHSFSAGPAGTVVLTGSGKLSGRIRGTGADAGSHKTCGAHFFGDVGAGAFRAKDVSFFPGKDKALKFFFAMVAVVFENRHRDFLKFNGS